MEIQFQFKNQETDVFYRIKTDDEEPINISRALAEVVGRITELYPDLPDDLGFDEVQGRTCYTCDREFHSPANLKQHQTVSGHNGVASDS